MARKFDDIRIDGGKRVREVIAKIDHPSGKFEADMDGVTHVASSLDELKASLRKAAGEADALPYTAFYRIEVFHSVTISAVAISNQIVVVKGARRHYGSVTDDETHRMFSLALAEDLQTDEPVYRGHQELRSYMPRDKEILLPVSETTRQHLVRLRDRVALLRAEEESAHQCASQLNKAVSEALSGTGLHTTAAEAEKLVKRVLAAEAAKVIEQMMAFDKAQGV